MWHSYLEPKKYWKTRAQLISAKKVGAQLFRAKNAVAQLFIGKKYCSTAIYCKKIQENWGTAI